MYNMQCVIYVHKLHLRIKLYMYIDYTHTYTLYTHMLSRYVHVTERYTESLHVRQNIRGKQITLTMAFVEKTPCLIYCHTEAVSISC